MSTLVTVGEWQMKMKRSWMMHMRALVLPARIEVTDANLPWH